MKREETRVMLTAVARIDEDKIIEAYPELILRDTMMQLDNATNQLIIKRLTELNINPDVLKFQTEEINRLNNYINKYGWHDLRNNPDDLPEADERVIFWVGEMENEAEYWYSGRFKVFPHVNEVHFENDDNEQLFTQHVYKIEDVIAWKRLDLEPFEEAIL